MRRQDYSMHYYKVYCSYNGDTREIYYATTKDLFWYGYVPVGLKALVDIWNVDNMEEITEAEYKDNADKCGEISETSWLQAE